MRTMITNIDTGEITEELEFDSANEKWQYMERSPMPACAYRIQIDPGDPGYAISDVFVVMD